MSRQRRSAFISLWANRLVFVLVTALVALMPWGIEWYCRFRPLGENAQRAILIAYYGCVVFIYLSQWAMEQLLRNILAGQVFVQKNVNLIRRVRFSCGAIGVICLPAACFYTPLLFVVVIMAFLCLVISVIADVMHGAVKMREENDLTI